MREDWSGVDFWFTDERCVPPDHEHSNFGMADRALLSRVEGATVHRMRGELGPEDGAAAYENELDEFGPEALDLILVGVGPDAHILLAVPGRRRRWASASAAWWGSRRPEWRRWCRASRLRFRW